MGSSYASGRSSGGSPYANATPSSGSTYGSASVGSDAPQAKGHGGFFHWVAQKADLAAHDIKAIPGGLVQAGKALDTPFVADYKLLTKGQKAAAKADQQGQKRFENLAEATAVSTKQTVEHPLRDPFQTALLASAAFNGGAGTFARAAEAGKALDAGEGFSGVAKAALSHPPVKPRLITVGDRQVPLHASNSPGVRAAQSIHDHIIQRAIDTNPESRVAAYGTRRAGQALKETATYQQRMRNVPADVLERQGKKLSRVDQAALELTSTNTDPGAAAAFHEGQAAKGVNPKQNAAVARLYRQVEKTGRLTKTSAGDVVVNTERFPKLAAVDARLADVQKRGDQILQHYNVRTAEGLKTRVDAPGKVRAGATFETPTPGKMGRSQAVFRAQARVDRLQTLYDRAVERSSRGQLDKGQRSLVKNAPTPEGVDPNTLFAQPGHHEISPTGNTVVEGRILSPNGAATRDRLGAALSVAKDELQRVQEAAKRRERPTGFVGGESARPGRGFVSYKTVEPKAQRTSMVASNSPVVGIAKSPVGAKQFTGTGIEQGLVPKDVTGGAARQLRSVMRFHNTSEYRDQIISTGSTARRSSRDVLIRVPGEKQGVIPPAVEDILGRKKLTTDDVEGINAALEAYRNDLLPGLAEKFKTDRSAGIGTPAPEGMRWVDRNVLGELGRYVAPPRGKIARRVDALNSAVTAATVYFKIGHIGTRVLTNAATNIVQGSARPLEIAQSVKLWKQLSDDDKMRALAAAGQHSFSAMPHEGQGLTARIAGKGANFWARHADAPFRFNSLAYEARKAGFDTPAQFRELLDKLENPHAHNMNAAETAKVDWVAKRANREAIRYDSLSDSEKRFITRAVWFYPWIKGTVEYAGHTLLEHPLKAEAGALAGQQGKQLQGNALGDLPSYEYGLIPFSGGQRPTVADFSTFSPFATPADVLGAVARPGEIAGFANPAIGAGLTAFTGINQYGTKTKTPVSDALAQLFSPTPEAQVVSAYMNRHKNQSQRMFETTPLSALERSLVGPGMPRRINKAAANRAAARERKGQ